MAINPITGLEEDKIDTPKLDTFTTPGLGIIQDIKQDPLKATEITTEEAPISDEVINIEAPTLIESKTEVNPIQGADLVTDIGEEKKGDVPTLILDRATFKKILGKKEADQTEEEKALLREYKAGRSLGETSAEIFGETTGGTTGVDTTGLDAEAAASIEALKKESALALESKQDEVDLRLAQAKTDIEERGKNRMNVLDRGLSFSGFGRSSTAVQKRDELQSSINAEIRQAQAKADLEVQLFKAQQAGADAETISAINKNLADATSTLKKTETENAIDLAKASQELGLKADEALDAFLNGTAAGIEAKDKGFDKDASLALGYVSDAFGNPLVDDAEGNPIAFTGNELGSEVKITNFKDANDNTYVYKNGLLSHVIGNDGIRLTADEYETGGGKVPAGVLGDKQRKETIDRTENLRKEFNGLTEIKEFKGIQSAFEKVKSSGNAVSPAGDMAMIFNFMKMLDPGSVVREAEFASAAKAAPLLERAGISFDKVDAVWGGKILTPSQRKDFLLRAEDIFNGQKGIAQDTKDFYGSIADKIGINQDEVFSDFSVEVPKNGIELDNDETTELDTLFPKDETTGDNTFKTKSGKQFNINLGGNSGEPTSATNNKVSGILGNLASKVTVVEKGGDNPVLGLSGGSLTYRTNNPLAITATGAGSAERLTNKFGAIPDLFSPDSADNLVLNFKTPEEGLRAGVQLLESKGNLSINQLMESHTGTSATGHKAQAKKLGINLNTKFKDLSPEDKMKVVEAIKIGEGFKQGTIIS